MSGWRCRPASLSVALIALAACLPLLAQQPAPLANADVAKMLAARLGESVIVAAIAHANETAFDTTPDALARLKKAGATDAVLTAMITARRPAPASLPSAPAAPPAAAASAAATPAPASTRPSRSSGIYVEVARPGTAPDLVPLEPTVIARTRTRGTAASMFTMGIAKTEFVAELRGPRASLRITDPQPTFYFYFPDRGGPLDQGPFVGWLAAASSPNEFVLLEMYRERDRRDMIVGRGSAWGASSGVDSENTVAVTIERLAPGEYRVRPESPFTHSGEFCFFYSVGAGALGGGGVGKLFDFGIDVR